MTANLAALARQLIANPVLTEAIIALEAALEEDDVSGRLAALDDACVSPHELEALLAQVEALAAELKKTPQGQH